ncbi:MAG TPA: hypothetical protein VFH79_08815, partial [Candidatus Limnocylindria bacterium]|nr:hypothetical protein [Candidatus Limnocylindria bacterium]
MADPDVVKRGPRISWLVLLTGGVAVVAAAVLAVLLLSRPDAPVGDRSPSPEASASAASRSAEPSSTASSEPSTTPDPTASQTATIRVAWSDAVSPIGEGFVSRVTAEGGRYFALGVLDSDATIWSSDDALEWEAATLPFPASWEREAPVF